MHGEVERSNGIFIKTSIYLNMKHKLKTDGLTGEQLKFAETLNTLFAEMPDATSAEDIQKAINKHYEEVTGEKGLFTIAMKAALAPIMSEDDPKSMASIIKRQGADIAALKEGGGKAETHSLESVFEACKDEFVAQAKNKTGAKSWEITFDRHTKAAAVTAISTGGSVTNSVTAATALRLGDGPFFEIKRGTPFILDFVNVGQTNQAYLIWWDEVAKEGDFAITAEGALKPLVQCKFVRRSADYKKAAGYSILTDEFMMDMPQLVTQIRRLAEIDLQLNINALILTDMIAAFPTFTFTGLNSTIYHADDYAAIAAAICQIQSLFFSPTVLVLNPADAWKMRLTKDDVGRYQMPPFAFNGQAFEFGQVITDPRIAIGRFLVGDGTTFNVDFRGGIIVRIGYNGTDFIQNQQTVVVEQYFYDYISNNRLGAWVYGNFSVIKGLINDTTNS